MSAASGWREIAAGLGGIGLMAAALATPFRRDRRCRWGLDPAAAARRLPGDELVREPRWSWTHGIELDAPAAAAWPWIAQIGADRGGFYSYQWLENLVGCRVRNADAIHPAWELREGDALLLHPRQPPLRVVQVRRGRHLVAHAAPEPGARGAAVSWLFLVEPLGDARCRVVSRYRCAHPDDLAMRAAFGPTLTEPIGFAMDRRMLMGIRRRAETAVDRRPGSGAIPHETQGDGDARRRGLCPTLGP
jgi:hypothetical protein